MGKERRGGNERAYVYAGHSTEAIFFRFDIFAGAFRPFVFSLERSKTSRRSREQSSHARMVPVVGTALHRSLLRSRRAILGLLVLTKVLTLSRSVRDFGVLLMHIERSFAAVKRR